MKKETKESKVLNKTDVSSGFLTATKHYRNKTDLMFKNK